jgi:hypothetical protein
MKIILIDDYPELKAFDRDLNLKELTVAKTVEDALHILNTNSKFNRMWLDGKLPDGTWENVLNWLSDHLDKVPDEIFSCSFGTSTRFYPMVEVLYATVKRLKIPA